MTEADCPYEVKVGDWNCHYGASSRATNDIKRADSHLSEKSAHGFVPLLPLCGYPRRNAAFCERLFSVSQSQIRRAREPSRHFYSLERSHHPFALLLSTQYWNTGQELSLRHLSRGIVVTPQHMSLNSLSILLFVAGGQYPEHVLVFDGVEARIELSHRIE